MTTNEEFHIEEYRQIRAEVIGQLVRIEQLFRYSIVVSATVTAWLLTSTLGSVSADASCLKVPRAFAEFGWWIAPAFVLVAGLMAAVLMTSVMRMGTYLCDLENTFGLPSLGWEKFNKKKNWIITTATGVVWVMLFLACAWAAKTAYPIIYNATTVCPHEKSHE